MSGYPIAYASAKRRAALRAMPYSEYLRTPEWAQVRWFALNEALHRCQVCPSIDDLEVHHRNEYECRGAETRTDVVVLCGHCHERHHEPMLDARRRTESAGVAIDLPPDSPILELARLRTEILAARQAGQHDKADALTREREALWRSLAKGRAA